MANFDASGEAGGTGLSKTIRSSGVSETYDLAGFGEAQAKDLIRDTFGQPIPALEPFRVTFVIGGGKAQNRQRYEGDLGRYVTAALREVDYTEDRAATALMECQGTYKSQHDTHRNIRTIQVFPRVELMERGEGDVEKERSRVSTTSPEYMCAVCAFDLFEEMVEEKVHSWTQKKRLLKVLGSFVARYREAEAKLTRMETLTEDEQDLYDNVDPDVMETKTTWLTSSVKSMVEGGRLTSEERDQVLAQVESKLQALSEEEKKATVNEDGKALARIQKQAQNLHNRRAMVQSNPPIVHKVKHQDELRDIAAKLVKIEKLENTRGRLLTIDEAKQVGAKEELLSRAKSLEQDSRGWFEEEDELQARLEGIRKQGQRMGQKMAVSKGGKAGAASGARGRGGPLAMDSDGWARVKR